MWNCVVKQSQRFTTSNCLFLHQNHLCQALFCTRTNLCSYTTCMDRFDPAKQNRDGSFAPVEERLTSRSFRSLPPQFRTPSKTVHWTKTSQDNNVADSIVLSAVLCGDVVRRINEVTLHRAGLVLRWVTIRGYTLLVFNQVTQANSAWPFLRKKMSTSSGKAMINTRVKRRLPRNCGLLDA